MLFREIACHHNTTLTEDFFTYAIVYVTDKANTPFWRVFLFVFTLEAKSNQFRMQTDPKWKRCLVDINFWCNFFGMMSCIKILFILLTVIERVQGKFVYKVRCMAYGNGFFSLTILIVTPTFYTIHQWLVFWCISITFFITVVRNRWRNCRRNIRTAIFQNTNYFCISFIIKRNLRICRAKWTLLVHKRFELPETKNGF